MKYLLHITSQWDSPAIYIPPSHDSWVFIARVQEVVVEGYWTLFLQVIKMWIVITWAQMVCIQQLTTKTGTPQERSFTRVEKSKYNRSKKVPNKQSLVQSPCCLTKFDKHSKRQPTHFRGPHICPSSGLGELVNGKTKHWMPFTLYVVTSWTIKNLDS